MNIDRIRYFSAVVDTKSVRKAAQLVGIAPASMSKAISILEGEIGEKLLFSDGRGIGITPKGQQLYHSSLPLLSEYKRFCISVQTDEQVATELRIGTFEVYSSYFLTSFIREVPEVPFQILEKTPGELEDAIVSGELDYGITYLPSPHAALDYIEIGSFKMGIFGKEKWRSLPFEEWLFAIPTTEIKIVASDTSSLDLWPTKAPRRNIKYRFELMETGLQVSAESLAVFHCPDFIVRLHNRRVKPDFQLRELPLPRGYGAQKLTKTYLVSRKGTSSRNIEGKLAKLMRSFK